MGRDYFVVGDIRRTGRSHTLGFKNLLQYRYVRATRNTCRIRRCRIRSFRILRFPKLTMGEQQETLVETVGVQSIVSVSLELSVSNNPMSECWVWICCRSHCLLLHASIHFSTGLFICLCHCFSFGFQNVSIV